MTKEEPPAGRGRPIGRRGFLRSVVVDASDRYAWRSASLKFGYCVSEERKTRKEAEGRGSRSGTVRDISCLGESDGGAFGVVSVLRCINLGQKKRISGFSLGEVNVVRYQDHESCS